MKKNYSKKLIIALAFFLTLSNISIAQISGLIQRFTFDNTLSNTSGTINFSSAAFTADRAGTANSALSLTGNGSTATIPNLPLGNSPRTFAMWFRLGTVNTHYNYLFNYGTSVAPYGAYVGANGVISFAPSHVELLTHIPFQWYHYVFSYDGTTSKIYRDGVLVGTSTIAVNTLNNNNLFRLGLSETGATGLFNGIIDELEIYNRALTNQEAASLFTPLPPIHHFTFDGTASNQNNTVSFDTQDPTISYTTNRFGVANKALLIQGSGTTAIINNLRYGNGPRSVAMWVKVDAFSSNGFNYLFNYGNGNTSYGAYLNATTVNKFIPNHTVATPHNLGVWYHYVFTHDGGRSRIYKNGVLIGALSQTNNTVNNNSIFRLGLTETGGTNSTAGGAFRGCVDDLMIYDRTLSADEVFKLYGNTPATPAVQWNFNSNTNADGGLYSFSTPSGTGLLTDRFGNANSALYLNNSGSVATGVTPLPTGNNPRTISFWFKRSQSDLQDLFVYGNSGSQSCFGLYVTASGSFVNYHTQNNSTYVAMSGSGNEPIAPDTWHHITVVYTQDSSMIYRNGSSIGRFAFNSTLTTSGTNFLLGKVLTTSQNPFQGTIDEIKVYNGALSPLEIANQYVTALPVMLKSFTAQVKNQTSFLNWQTAQEINTSHFEVEYSNNANEFKKVVTLEASGNSNSLKNYSLQHSINKEPIHYYRLKMVDKDGKFTYSNVVKLKAATKALDVEVYPTIITNQATVSITATEKAKARIIISNVQGQVIKNSNLNVAVGSQTQMVDFTNLSKGMYLLTVLLNNEQQVFKVIKQ
jgi:hypothetical protein